MALYLGIHQKVWFRLEVSLPESNTLVKKIPHRQAQSLGFS